MPRKSKSIASKRRAKAHPKGAPAKKKNGIGGMVGHAAGSAIGGKLGGPLGMKVGGAIGKLAGGAFAKLFGRGDYDGFDVTHNTLVIPNQADFVPLINADMGAVRVRHREDMGDLANGDGTFRNLSLVIQPMNAFMFPWLGTFAQSFEQYRMMGAVFEFKSLSATANLSTPALGSVMIATQYNVAVPAFASKVQVLNHYFATSGVPYRDQIHPIECKEMFDPLKVYYVRSGDEVVTMDARFMDYGVVNICTQGIPTPAGTVVGEMWISYDILLIKPRIRTVAGTVFGIDPLSPGPDPVDTVIHIPEWNLTPPPISAEKSPFAFKAEDGFSSDEKDEDDLPLTRPVLKRQRAISPEPRHAHFAPHSGGQAHITTHDYALLRRG